MELPEIRQPRKAPNQVFLRFGLWSRGDCRSINWATGDREKGLSVYPAKLINDKEGRINVLL